MSKDIELEKRAVFIETTGLGQHIRFEVVNGKVVSITHANDWDYNGVEISEILWLMENASKILPKISQCKEITTGV